MSLFDWIFVSTAEISVAISVIIMLWTTPVWGVVLWRAVLIVLAILWPAVVLLFLLPMWLIGKLLYR